MRSALTLFNALIEQAKLSEGLFQYFKAQGIPLNLSDLLRWQWILAVSALDKYIHDVVRVGMIEAFEERRLQTQKFQEFKINISAYKRISESPTPTIEFEREIVRQHSYLAFQLPEKIADALSYIWDENNKWDVISQNMTPPISAGDARTKQKNIITRRNQIVHEGDCLTTVLPLDQQQILLEDVQDVLRFVTDLANSIHNCIT